MEDDKYRYAIGQQDFKTLRLDLRNADPLALLYQTGYITIKDYDRENDSFLLGVPNLEVRQGLFDVLLPYYAFYILRTMLNFDVTAEASTSDGRIDLLLKSAKFIYIIELKYDGTARAALNQINDKKYDMQFHGDTRRLIKIGVNSPPRPAASRTGSSSSDIAFHMTSPDLII